MVQPPCYRSVTAPRRRWTARVQKFLWGDSRICESEKALDDTGVFARATAPAMPDHVVSCARSKANSRRHRYNAPPSLFPGELTHDRSRPTAFPKPRYRGQSRTGLSDSRQARAGAVQRARSEGLRAARCRVDGKADIALGHLDPGCAVRGGFRAALGAVLGHAAPARQQLRRAHAAGAAAGAAFRLRDGPRRTHARAPGQLRAGAHRPARRRDGGCKAPSLHHHRSARRPRSRHRRLQGRFAGRRGAARRSSGLLRDLLSRAGAGADDAGRLRRGAAVRASCARAASRTRRNPRSSATARAAGRR